MWFPGRLTSKRKQFSAKQWDIRLNFQSFSGVLFQLSIFGRKPNSNSFLFFIQKHSFLQYEVLYKITKCRQTEGRTCMLKQLMQISRLKRLETRFKSQKNKNRFWMQLALMCSRFYRHSVLSNTYFLKSGYKESVDFERYLLQNFKIDPKLACSNFDISF